MNEPSKRKRGRAVGYAGRPTTVTIYLSAVEEEALSDRAKAQKLSVPAFIGKAVRVHLQAKGRENNE